MVESGTSPNRARWKLLALLAVLAAVAVLVRLPHLSEEVRDDEAWYFELARTWGWESHWVSPPDDAGAQIAYRPLFFAVFWPFAKFGLTAARLGNLAASIALVLATFRLCRVQGASPSLAFVAGLILALNPVCEQFGVILTTDTLTALCAVVAVILAIQRRYSLAALWMSAAVLSKESSVVVAAATFAACAITEWRYARPKTMPDNPTSLAVPKLGKTRAHLWLVVPVALVALTQAVGMVAFGGRMPGWGNNLNIRGFLGSFMVGLPAIPIGVMLLFRGRLVILAAAASLPAFFLGWTLLLGRGVVGWYGVSMLPFVVAAYAVALSDLLDWVRQRFSLSAPGYGLFPALVLAALAPSWPMSWPPWHLHPQEGIMEVARAIEGERPRKVVLASCFWSLAHFPWRPPGASIVKTYAEDGVWSSSDLKQLRYTGRDADVIVYCANAAKAVRQDRGFATECTVFENKKFLVARGPKSCPKRPVRDNDRHRKSPIVGAATVRPPLVQAPSPPPGASGLARELTLKDMRFDACIKVGEDGVARGRNCTTPFPMFGPYIAVAAGSVLEVAFDLHARTNSEIGLDVVSGVGKRVHGAVLPERLYEDDEVRFSYRVAVAEGTEALETRLELTGAASYDFDISNFNVRVWRIGGPIAPSEPSKQSQ
jgi:hypothetical protein